MAEEEDPSSLSLPDRFAHKNWKVRKDAYEAAAKELNSAQSEGDDFVRQFIQDPGLWRAAVLDSNVAAQQEALAALYYFLTIAGTTGCTRTRHSTVGPIIEKGLSSSRPAAKEKALECILLYIELDKAEPVIEETLPFLSHKQPKIIASTLSALTSIYHAYGCKTVDPKPILKLLTKTFGHADKNVRAETQNLTVELYRWLREAMKPLFWNDLKPVQQQDLEKLFENVKNEPQPVPERLLKSQQAQRQAAAESGEVAEEEEPEDAEPEIDLGQGLVAVDVMQNIPKDLLEKLSSTKWKDRKDVLDDLLTAINQPKIREGHFDEIMRALAKCMKDANIAVVAIAANCIELFAKGLKKAFARYRSSVMAPMMERLKEKKLAVTEAIGAALDAIFVCVGFQECLEEILEFLSHKNPQVKLESTRFLARSLKITREAPQPAEAKLIAASATKLLTDSQEAQRSAGAEILGTLWKIMGDRVMNSHLEGLDDIRKAKIKEFYEAAEVKAKYKPKEPKPAPKAAPAAPSGRKKVMGGKRPAASGTKKPATAPATTAVSVGRLGSTVEEPILSSPAPKAANRPGISKLGPPKSGLAAPSAGLRLRKNPAGAAQSPRKLQSPPLGEAAACPTSKIALGPGRGLAGRPLGKPAPSEPTYGASSEASSGLSAVERAEFVELRLEVDRLRRQNEEVRSERNKLNSTIHELQNHNAQLIEDHTRDVLSIKAKETQLVRARSDAEAADQTVHTQQREVERLKRELSRQVRASSPAPLDVSDQVFAEGGALNGARPPPYARARTHAGAGGPLAEGKENVGLEQSSFQKLSPTRSPAPAHALGLTGRASPGLTTAATIERPAGSAASNGGTESWKRAAEVTQNLRARIESLKARQGLSRPH